MQNDELKARIAAIFDVTVEEIDAVDTLLRPAEERAQQEKREFWRVLEKRLTEMWEVINAVATLDGNEFIYYDTTGEIACLFCDASTPTHKPDCIVLKARTFTQNS